MDDFSIMDSSYSAHNHPDGTPEHAGLDFANPASSHLSNEEQQAQTNIPLVCSICPKNSTFSDLSHLLTHVSSKGHLHNYFQLSITRDTDREAHYALAQYDAWFEANGINALLRVRKNARDQKGTDSQPRGQSRAPGLARGARGLQRRGSRGGRGYRGGRVQAQSRPRTRRQDNVNAEVKEESDEGEGFGGSYDSPQLLNNWSHSSMSYASPHGLYIEPKIEPGALDFDEDDSSNYEPSEQDNEEISEAASETMEDGTRLIVLKGVVYPGMSGFDSATKEEAKMRNQRKDPSKLRMLKRNSETITTREDVLDMNLSFLRDRSVYAEPSIDGSGDEEEQEPTPEVKRSKRRAYQSSTVKTKQSTATSRQQARASRSNRAARPSSRMSYAASALPSPALPMGTSPIAGSGRVTRSSANRSRNSQLPLHSHGFQSHTETDIFQDDFDHHPAEGPNFSPSGPGRRRQSARLPGLALRPGNPNISFASPAPGLKRAHSQLYPGKENNHLVLKPPVSPDSSSNPYLQTLGEPMDSNYNPLFVQPQDELGFRMYSPYDEDAKPPSTQGFQPINGPRAHNSLQLSAQHATAYHRTYPGGDEYSI
ncbi:hypothetical protein GGR56DRAFT_229155 [Xylariaceae sp. FL0804]|nr:hypothetical protein GGR56DRAFT_229155 [Xylariaceae sp. FL0804]